MKKIILSLALVVAGITANAQSNSINSLSTDQMSIQSVSEYKTGTIIELNSDGGKIMEEGTGIIRDFFHPQAQVIFNQGQGVEYVIITFPNGKPPIVIDVKGR